MPAQQSDQSQSTPASIIKHLHELAQQSKIAAAQHQSKQQVDQVSGYGQGTPETAPESGISYVTPVKEARNLPSNAESPVNAKPIGSLPPNWKTATDPEGKIYYYHILTRYVDKSSRAHNIYRYQCSVSRRIFNDLKYANLFPRRGGGGLQ